jgi:hypothetical protein
MGALSGLGVGAAVGGIAGALIGMGIPEYEAKRYEGRIKSGNILLSVLLEPQVSMADSTNRRLQLPRQLFPLLSISFACRHLRAPLSGKWTRLGPAVLTAADSRLSSFAVKEKYEKWLAISTQHLLAVPLMPPP